MTTFDIDAYLKARLGGPKTNSKVVDVAQAAEVKKADLGQKSWVEKIGLTPGDFLANRVNDVASIVSGASRMAGQILSLPVSTDSLVASEGILPGDIEAFNRVKTNQATPQDIERLNRQAVGQASVLSRLRQMENRRTTARGVSEAFDLEGIVDQTNRQGLVQDLGAGFEENWAKVQAGGLGNVASGLAGLFVNAGASVLSNPSAVREYVLENAPQLFVGALGKAGQAAMAASNVGYAADTFQQGMENYARANGGQLPPLEQQQRMAMQAASLALAEQVGDMASLGATKLAGRTAQGVSSSGLKAVAGAAAKGGLTEAPTEGFQTYMEGEVTGKPASAEEIYTGAVIGGASGAVLAGGGRALYEMSKTGEAKPARPDIDQLVTTGIKSGDVSALANPKASTYSPAQAVAALFGNAQKEDVSDEAKAQHLSKAAEIVAELEREREMLQEQLATPEQKQARIQDLERQVATARTPKIREILESDLGHARNDLAKPLDPKTAKTKQARLADIEQELQKVALAQGELTDLVATPARVEKLVEQGTPEAARAVINLSMASPEALSPEVATKLADNQANGLTDLQRQYLRTFSQARIKQNELRKLGSVTKEVLEGTAENMGLAQYTRQIGAAIARGDRKTADRLLGWLGNFEQDHAEKAAVARKAIAKGRGTQIVRTTDRRWEIGTAPLTKEQLRTNGGLSMDSPRLVGAIGVEATAIAATAQAMRAAYAAAFNTTTTEKANGKDVSAQGANEGTEREAASVQGTGQAGARSAAAEPAAAPSAGAPAAVEGAGVTATQAEYDEAVRVSRLEGKSAEYAYETVPSNIARLVQALTDGDPITVVPSPAADPSRVPSAEGDSVSSAGAESTQSAESTESTATADSVPTVEEKESVARQEPVSQAEAQPDDETVESSTEESSETNLQESPEGTNEADAQASGLTSLRDGREFNKQFAGQKLKDSFRLMNKAAAWLKQISKPVHKDSDIPSVRPLVAIQNFLSRWKADDLDAESFFPDGLSDEGKFALTQFRDMATAWAKEIRTDFIKGSLPNSKGNRVAAEWLYQDPVQDFFNADGTVDENVVTAVAYAAYTWYADSAVGPARKTKEEILKMHGLKPDGVHDVTFEGERALRLMTAQRDAVVNSLGDHIVEALGLKASKDAPANYLSTVSAAFGLHALLQLERAKLVSTEVIDGSDLVNYITGLDNVSEHAKWQYIKLTRAKDLKLPDTGRAIRDVSVGSEQALGRLFSTKRNAKESALRPIPFDQEEAKRTNQAITKEQLQVVADQQRVPLRPIPAMDKALQVLGDKAFLLAAGWREEEDSRVQWENRAAVETQNENLENQLTNAKRIIEDGRPRYIAHEVWSNFRVGIATQDLNPQSSKLHRFMFHRPDWKARLELNNEEHMTLYFVAVAQALGVKVDQQSNEKSAEWVLNWLNDPDNRMRGLIEKMHGGSELTDAEKQEIGEFAADKEGMQTLQALVSLGEYLAAFEAEGVDSFETTMLVGVDGKANGPMLTILALGAAENADDLFGFVNRGGFYREEDGVTNFSQWYAQGGRDLYQDLASQILTGFDISKPEVRRDMVALSVITKKLMDGGKITSAGRTLAKTPQTAFNFGAAVQRAVLDMQEWALQSVFDRIEDVATGRSKESRERLIAAINYFTSDPKLHIPADADIEYLMNFEFTKQHKQQLKNGFGAVLGPVVEKTMETYYEPLIRRRNAMNKNVQVAYGIYEQVYQDLYAREMQRLMDEGEIAFDQVKKKGADGVLRPTGERKPLHDMTLAQREALREKIKAVLPLAHTAYSVREGSLDAGLYMAKRSRKQGKEPFFNVKAQFGRPFVTGEGYQAVHALATGMTRTEASPGVGGLAYFMHSFDSAVMHRSIKKRSHTFNVHDEAGNGVDKVNLIAGAINQSLWDSLLDFSPSTEAFQMLERAVTNVVKLAEQGVVTPQTLTSVRDLLLQQLPKKVRNSLKPEDVATVAMGWAKAGQFRADEIRLEGLSQVTVIDQYTWEGGEYRTTEQDRQKAAELLSKHRKQGSGLSAQTAAAAQALGKMFADAEKGTASVAAPARIEVDALVEKKETPFGQLGEPTISSDPDLVKFFESNPQTTAEQVIQKLYRKLKNDERMPNREFSLQLLQRLQGLVGKNVTVRYVTPDTAAADVLEPVKQPSRAWFVSGDKGTEIYVLSPAFRDSALTAEALLHEITHAALAQVIENPTGEAVVLVRDLEALLAEARKISPDHPGVASVQELVAWGLTNRKFQGDVLAKISMKSTSWSTKLVQGMNAFTGTLVRLLFKNADARRAEIASNGLGILIGNVSGLIAASEQANQRSPTPVAPGITGLSKLVGTLRSAADSANEVDAWEDPSPDAQKLVVKEQAAYAALYAEVSRLIGRMGQFGTPYVEELQEVLDTEIAPDAGDDSSNADLIDLAERAAAYAREFASKQQSLNLSMAAALSRFRSWFGQSKVVGEDGQALRVYHGTQTNFDEFRAEKLGQSTGHSTAKMGFFFSADPKVAELFAGELWSGWPLKRGFVSGANVMPVYLQIERPFTLSAAEFLTRFVRGQEDAQAFAEELKRKGHDGVQITADKAMAEAMGGDEYGADAWIAFGPTQIKSATGNNGNFDPKSPLILSMAAAAQANTYSTLDLYQALDDGKGTLGAEFDAQLRGLLSGIVERLHGPFGSFKAQLMTNQAGAPIDVWAKAMATGKAPFATQALAAGFRISGQEAFAIEQVEATVRAAIDGNEAHTKMAYRELSQLYLEAYQRLKPADFPSQEMYDFVFKLEKGAGNRSDYLARFAAMGLAHKDFAALLDFSSKVDGRSWRDGKTFAERLQIIFENILEFFQTKVTHTFRGQQADSKLKALVEQLVDIEAKQRDKLANQLVEDKIFGPVERAAKKVADKLRNKVVDIASSPAIKNSANGFVAGGAGVVRTFAAGRVEAFMDNLMSLRDRQYPNQLQGVLSGLANEARGAGPILEALLRARKRQEGERKDVITATAKMVLGMFAGGRELANDAKAAVSQVLLRTGVHGLLVSRSMAQIENLLADQAALEAEIGRLEQQLPSQFQQDMVFQAKALAYYKVTGINRSPMLLLNAHNIAHLAGLAKAAKMEEGAATQAEPVIAQLVALYGLRYSKPDQVTSALAVLRRENQRTDGGNGAEFMLRLHARMEKESLDRLFGGNPALMVHGYTSEIYNPHTAVVTATEEQGKLLVAQGYVKGAAVSLDPADPDREVRHLYVLRDGGLQPWQSGIVSTTGMTSKGSAKHSGYLNPANQAGLRNAVLNADVLHARQQAMARMGVQGLAFDPRKDSGRYMAPVFNESGEIVNWRYLMAEQTKDNLLERDNRFEQVLGALAGSIYDKATAGEVNEQVIAAAKQIYDKDFARDSDSFVVVGPKSKDATLRETWELLPDVTKAMVRRIWGKEGMTVRADQVDIIFGYRKLSLADAFEKDPKVRSDLERFYVDVMEMVLGKKAALRIRQGERGWQEIVHEAKDILVVKSGVVLLGNIWSNLSLLWMQGVPMREMVHHHLVALRGATAYQADSDELRRLRTLLDSGFTQGKVAEIRREIVRLEDALARNLVGKLIEAGLMPTIVEDVAAEENIYSYKSQLARKVEGVTDKLPGFVSEAGRTVYMAHDTKLYQALSRATQLSDFVARYALYQHLVSRQDNPLDPKVAIQEASDSFVNYDVPAHRKIQWANDMGLLMFTKYFLRIQKVLHKVSQDSPLRYYSVLALNNFLALGPIVLESLWLAKLGNNPLRPGALAYPGTLDDLATISTAMKLLK